MKDSNVINPPHLKEGVTTGINEKKTYNKPHSSYSVGRGSFGIFKLFFLILIMVLLVRFLYNPNSIVNTLSFLDMLSDLPSVSSSFKSFWQMLEITSDWGLFNFLRDFLNFFVDIGSVAMWICGSIIDLLSFVLSFVRYLFV